MTHPEHIRLGFVISLFATSWIIMVIYSIHGLFSINGNFKRQMSGIVLIYAAVINGVTFATIISILLGKL